MKKLVILGLDGLDKKFIEDNKDKFSNLIKIQKKDLESTLPPITMPAWPASLTGKRPEELDRFDFQKINYQDYSFNPAVWNWEGEEYWSYTDTKCLVSDVPGGTKGQINGYWIGGLFDTGEGFHPESLKNELESELGEFQIEGLESFETESERREKAFEFFQKRKKLLFWFIEKKSPEICFQVFRLPDTMMHHCSSNKDMIKAYKKCDQMLGELMERDNLEIIVLSDHGAVKADRRFSINTWFKKNGYLSTRNLEKETGGDFREKISDGIRSFALRVAELGERFGFRDYLVRANEIYGEIIGEEFVDTNLDLDSIDWDNTEAFSYMTGVCRYSGIWINDSRFPQSAVEDRQAKKEQIKKELEKHDLIEQVLLKENAFQKDAKTFPDLVAVLKEKVKNDSDIKPSVTGKISSYMHRKQGFLGVYGDSFDLTEDNAELIDLAPTILHYLGEDIPEEMDGKVMDIFSKDSEPGKRKPSYTSEDVTGLDI